MSCDSTLRFKQPTNKKEINSAKMSLFRISLRMDLKIIQLFETDFKPFAMSFDSNLGAEF